ncbi:hypothetical protein GGR56DRAFT_299901 [Xylariaceae sp. FL0804]|nr:hypothetical protein GGR56DRAFT_299901 [Xylariaceae sp. FL0804]
MSSWFLSSLLFFPLCVSLFPSLCFCLSRLSLVSELAESREAVGSRKGDPCCVIYARQTARRREQQIDINRTFFRLRPVVALTCIETGTYTKSIHQLRSVTLATPRTSHEIVMEWGKVGDACEEGVCSPLPRTGLWQLSSIPGTMHLSRKVYCG